MTKLTTAAALLLTCLSAAAGMAAPAPKSMTFSMSTVTDAQGMHVNVTGKVWVKGQKARFEANHPMMGPMVVLVNGPRVHRLFPQRSTELALRRHKSDIISNGQRKEAHMGLTNSINVLIVGAAFVFVATMLFI